MTIKKYTPEDEQNLFALIENEGEDWAYYCTGAGKEKYLKALSHNIVYVLYVDETLCGYARCSEDEPTGIYVLDLLVNPEYRGNEYGRLLMEKVVADYPDTTVYVNSDVNPYYEKLGYKAIGSIFMVSEAKYEIK
jgi:ribosomal protein S18 acetylase RimI-like enzyme